MFDLIASVSAVFTTAVATLIVVVRLDEGSAFDHDRRARGHVSEPSVEQQQRTLGAHQGYDSPSLSH